MYEIKPIFDQTKVNVDLPTCMYKVKNIYDSSLQKSSTKTLTNGYNGAASNDGDLNTLKKRQTEIVKQLEQLRLRLNDMQKKLGATPVASAQQPTTKSAVAQPNDMKNLQDIVIHVNPTNIPFSLLGLQSLWANRLNLTIECYTHSSIVSLPVQNREFAKRASSLNVNAKVPTLNVTIIWKKTTSTQLVCAPGTFIPICGEPNIIRYLIRIGPSEFGYKDASAIQANLEIDLLFDLVHELLSSSNKDQRSSILRRISQRLGTKKTFGGQTSNVSDIAVLSVLKQLNLNAKELPANVKSWQEKNKTILAV